MTDDWQDWFHTVITQLDSDSIVMLVGNTAQHCRLGLLQDSDFVGDLEDSKSTLGGVLCFFLDEEHLSPSVGCARNKRQYPTDLQSLKSFFWMLDCAWMYYLLSTFGDVVIEVLRSTNNTARQGRLAQGNLCTTGHHSNIKTRPKHQLKRESERLSNCQIWIAYPPTHILLKASLSCTFLKTTKLSSR